MSKDELFRTAYGKHPRGVIATGNGHEIEYGYEINKTGQKVLVQKGLKDVYTKIQEAVPETLIENILARVGAGDNTVLRPSGVYMDCTEQPRNLIEARQMILNLENTWASLSAEQRADFDNDVEKFVAESGSENWFKKLGMIKETPVEAKVEAPTETKGEQTE